MASLQSVVSDLVSKCNLTEHGIVNALSEYGVTTSQATINRIKNGNDSARPSYELGCALLRLHGARMRKRARAA